MNENNEILHDDEEEDSDKQPDLKQAAETQQPSPQPNIKWHATKKNKKAIKNSVSIASVMEEICREVETDTPLQSLAVATLPANAGNDSRGLWSQAYADTRQVQGESMNTSNEEEDSDNGDYQCEDDDEEEAKNNGQNNDNINEDTARMEKYLKLYFQSLAKSGTTRTAEEEVNLVTAKLGQVFKCQKFIISDKDLSEQGLITQTCFRRWRSLKSSDMYGGKK